MTRQDHEPPPATQRWGWRYHLPKMTKRRRLLYIGAGLVVMVLAVVAAVSLTARGASSEPIPAAGGTSAAIPTVDSVPYYLQNDSEWAALTLGDSSETMRGAGCTVCCIAMGVSALGYPMDPAQVCSDLSRLGGFTDEGQVIWSTVAELTDGEVRIELPAPDYETIDLELTEGRPVIAKIMLAGTVPHWVLIVGKNGEQYLVMDPLDQGKGLGRLSDRSTHIEAIRVFAYAGPL